MMLILRDDPVIEVFESPEAPPSWIEVTDVANGEYCFCNDSGQIFKGVVVRSKGWFGRTTFELRPEGTPNLSNALALVNRATSLEPNKWFSDLRALRTHLEARVIKPQHPVYKLIHTEKGWGAPNDFFMHYEWEFLDDNHEWRDCVADFLSRVRELNIGVDALEIPPFQPHEDFVELIYLIQGSRVVFSSDCCLCLIVVAAESPFQFKEIWNQVGEKTGWAS